MDKKIQNLLLRLGINSTYLGHKYLAYALSLCIQNEDYLTSVYKVLCMEVATHYATTCFNVEHCLRTAIKHCWEQGNSALLKEVAMYPLTDKPTNGQFIDILYHHLVQ